VFPPHRKISAVESVSARNAASGLRPASIDLFTAGNIFFWRGDAAGIETRIFTPAFGKLPLVRRGARVAENAGCAAKGVASGSLSFFRLPAISGPQAPAFFLAANFQAQARNSFARHRERHSISILPPTAATGGFAARCFPGISTTACFAEGSRQGPRRCGRTWAAPRRADFFS